MKQDLKILINISKIVCIYFITMFLFSLLNKSKPNSKNNTTRPYFGEIEQAENDFVNSELEKLNN